MQSETHKRHIASRISHNNCSECRADTERQFVSAEPWRYFHIHEYLAYIRPRLAALRKTEWLQDPDACIWRREFLLALNRRISLKCNAIPVGRKWCDSYLERLRGALRIRRANRRYLLDFAQRGASCLDDNGTRYAVKEAE